jgi:hypothetical protein
MAQRPNPHLICTETEYQAARTELDELLGRSSIDLANERRVDELIELIENYEAAVRFVPDWSGESYQNAA